MTTNEHLITNFYEAFAQKDLAMMASLYHKDATFKDPIFYLKGDSIMDMWTMLLKSSNDVDVSLRRVKTHSNKLEASWHVTYTFSATGNYVHNTIWSTFTIKDGKIYTHTDHFSFYKWAKRAFGFTGLLLGWTAFFHNKVRREAMEKLEKFKKKQLQA